MSSGLRINSAEDDAAGLAISRRLLKIRGLDPGQNTMPIINIAVANR